MDSLTTTPILELTGIKSIPYATGNHFPDACDPLSLIPSSLDVSGAQASRVAEDYRIVTALKEPEPDAPPVSSWNGSATLEPRPDDLDPIVALPVLAHAYPPPNFEPPPVYSDSASSREAQAQMESASSHKYYARLQLVAVSIAFFLGGWNDAATGPLLPTVQRIYHVNFSVVSLLFIGSSLGFILGGVANLRMSDKLGQGKTMVAGALSQVTGYSIQSGAPPFPLLIVGSVFNGFGWGLQMAQGTSYVASLSNNASTIGIVNAAYGVGALIVPLVSTHFAQTRRWSFHYLTSLGITILDAAFLVYSLRFKSQEELLQRAGELPHNFAASNQLQTNKWLTIMRLREVHILAFWAFVYVGVEVTTGGWINTFLMDLRGASPSAGYVATGFWAGLTVGRVAFLWVNMKIGERRAIFIYSAFAIGLQVTIWVVPSLIENALAVALIGLFLGPMFPIAMKQTERILPRVLLTGAIGWIASIGQAGSALLPFINGALANKFGIVVLQPFVLTMMAAMVGFWALVPTNPRRLD